jgi:hypothetical protein
MTSGLLVVCLGGGVAGASPFVMMDRQDDTSMVGGELMYTLTDSDRLDATLIRFDGHFQYVTGDAGVYGTVPIAYAAADGIDTVTAIGDIEVGGIYNIHSNAETTIVLHGGVLLPTASDDGNDFVFGVLASDLRVHDLYQWIPKGTSVRLAVSPVYRSGNLFLRGDVGLDFNIDTIEGADINNVVHVNAGVGGWLSPQFTLSGELISLHALDGDGDDDDIELAVTGRYHSGGVSPYFGLVVPTDSDISDFITAALVFGVDGRL